MTAVTGTGFMRLLVPRTEHFDDLSVADSNFEGVFPYLNWSRALLVNHITLLNADYVNFDNLIVYLHWGFELSAWNYEHSDHIIDVLIKCRANYHIFP